MKRKVTITLILLAVIGFGLSLETPGPACAKTIQLNYANFTPAPTFPCIQMERWKIEVEKRTNGKVKVNTYPGATLLGAKNMIDGVTTGIADVGNLCMAYQPGRFPVTNATSLPLNIPDAQVGSLVLLDLWKKYQPKEFSKVKVIGMFTSAPTNIMSTVPVKTLDDIKGMSLRASGGAAQILSAWQANAVGMPMPATVEALQKGIVKGLFSSLEVMKDLKFAETCKYVTMTNTVVYPFAVVMNKRKWKTLPGDVKKVIEDLVVDQAKWTGDYMDNHVRNAVVWSKDTQNVTFLALTGKQLESWNMKLQFLIKDWVDEAQKTGMPGEEIIGDIRSLIKKHAKNDQQ